MVQCPECQKEQEADFGMVTCASCGAVFMVEFDGSVNQPDAIEYESAPPPDDEPHLEVPTEDSEDVSAPVEAVYDENFLEPLSEVAESEEELPPRQTTDSIPANDPLGIQKFDVSGGSNLPDGEYLYDILISGIDSGEIKKSLLQALSDKRFALAMEDLRAKVRDGQLSINGLNPVRAMLIVLKLQEMDVQIEWRQKHYAQEPESREPEVEQ